MKTLKIVLFILSFAFFNSVIAQNVYTTKTGEKYHKSSCRYLKYSKKEYTLKKALALGFVACSVCKPTKSNLSSSLKATSSSNSSTSRTATASQCTGKTKAGKRCKRKTKSVNGRCYQH
ncbi:hypothetical protein [Lacinutrix chionoecetis]